MDIAPATTGLVLDRSRWGLCSASIAQILAEGPSWYGGKRYANSGRYPTDRTNPRRTSRSISQVFRGAEASSEAGKADLRLGK